MKIRTLALVLGSALVVTGGGVAATACSSSNSGTPSGTDSGGGKDGTANSDGGGTGDDGGIGDDGGTAVDCGKSPGLHPEDAGTIFCGFADAGKLECTTGNQCCLGGKLGQGFAPEQCVQFGSACTNGADGGLPVQCGQPSDCTANGQANSVCCLRGNAPAQVAGCGYYKASGGQGTFCEQSCQTGETQLCESNGDCPSGKTCTPFKWKVLQFGFCL